MEIKFRGFYHHIGNALYPEVKKWVYGFLIIEDGKYWIKDGKLTSLVKKESVGQLVGIPDYNGTAIYYGDILGSTVDLPEGGGEHKVTGVVEFLSGAFKIHYLNAGWGSGEVMRHMVIIGNRWENPELLEGHNET